MAVKESFSVIILAAGLSSRMGTPKQLLSIDGLSMLDHAVEAALAAGLDSPIVVLGHTAEQIKSQARLLSSCTVVINDSYRSGLSTSLKCGIEASRPETTAYVFMLADQPLVTGTLIKKLLKAFEERRPDILHPVYQGQRGNPVIITSRLRKRLLEAKGDSGARFLFNDPHLTIIPYPVTTPAVIVDIDTPEDLQKFNHDFLLGKDR